MKRNELLEIKSLDLKDLRQKSNALRKEIAEQTMEKNMKKLKDIKLVSKRRKDLAQILTVMRQKALLAELEPVVEKNKPIELKNIEEDKKTKV